jgi:hypothetical protein
MSSLLLSNHGRLEDWEVHNSSSVSESVLSETQVAAAPDAADVPLEKKRLLPNTPLLLLARTCSAVVVLFHFIILHEIACVVLLLLENRAAEKLARRIIVMVFVMDILLFSAINPTMSRLPL